MSEQKLKFSIITPSFNEEKDIRKTIEAFLDFNYDNKEIIIVDDSTDRTPEIVKEFESRGVKLIRGKGEGCCEAVNLGIQSSTGDIIINADADVRPPKDFLEKLNEKYNEGADWVLVDSRIPDYNHNSLFSRYSGALHIAEHPPERSDMYYAEAFSCRRKVAIELGMFGPSYPARFCRDWVLGKKLTEAGYKKVYDPKIVVLHPQPDNLKEFWNTRKARGRFGPLKLYFMDNKSLLGLFIKLIIKDLVFIIRFITIIPAALYVFNITKHSSRKIKDFLPFYFAHIVQEAARVFGEWEGFLINIKSSK